MHISHKQRFGQMEQARFKALFFKLWLQSINIENFKQKNPLFIEMAPMELWHRETPGSIGLNNSEISEGGQSVPWYVIDLETGPVLFTPRNFLGMKINLSCVYSPSSHSQFYLYQPLSYILFFTIQPVLPFFRITLIS